MSRITLVRKRKGKKMNNFQLSASEFYRQSKYLCKNMLSKSVPICDFNHMKYKV